MCSNEKDVAKVNNSNFCDEKIGGAVNHDMRELVKGKRVLLLEGYARQILPFLKVFKNFSCDVTVLCDSKLDVAWVSKYPDHKILGVCNADKYDETVEWVKRLVNSDEYDITIPMGDLSARILSENKSSFQQHTIVASNDKDIFERSLDKLNVMRVCMANGIPCPYTIATVENVDDIKSAHFQFPIVIKPRRDCGARGFRIVQSLDQLEEYVENRAIELSECVVQEFVPPDAANYSVNMYIDRFGVVKSAFVYASCYWYPLKGGTGTLNISVDCPEAVLQCVKLAGLMGLRGCIGFDLMHDKRDGTYRVLEINPRAMACIQIGFLLGVNVAQQVLEDNFGFDVTEMKTCDNRSIGVRMSQIDILRFIKSQDRFTRHSMLRGVERIYDQTFSLSDPLPWFAFLLRGMKRFKSETKKRS